MCLSFASWWRKVIVYDFWWTLQAVTRPEDEKFIWSILMESSPVFVLEEELDNFPERDYFLTDSFEEVM